jgi:rod shape-determining protein MreC
VPRNRSVRVAVLGSSVQRSATPGYSSTRSGALRRRAVVGFLVLAAFVLLTISFRSSALDGVEGAGASALRPFETAANRVARPFRDATGYTRGLFDAKRENQKLRRQNDALRREFANLSGAAQRNVQLEKLLRYSGAPTFPHDFTSVAAQVMTNPTAFEQSITVAAGANQGVKDQDVVVTNDGLVGQVTKVSAQVSRVMLITSASSSVTAVDEQHSDALGQLDPGSGSGSLVLDDVDKSAEVQVGDTIITAGSPGSGKLPSLFPRGIVIGTVTSAGQNDTDIYKDIQVTPYANLGSLQTVLVLVPKPVTKAKHK